MAEIGNLTLWYEVHDGGDIYRMYPPVAQESPGNANMTPMRPEVERCLIELSHLPVWRLFQAGGQVCTLTNPAWRIDVQARDQARYLWAFQGPPGPPTYAIVRADRDIERFGEMLVKGQVKLALWNSMRGQNTWYIRVEKLRRDKRKRPGQGDTFIRIKKQRPMLKKVMEPTVLTETKINKKDVENLFMCAEQQPNKPNKAAMTPDLSKVVVEFLKLLAGVHELWTSAAALAGLASRMATSDTAHGAVETTAGGLGVVGGGLMIGGVGFPLLFIAGAIVGGVSAVGGLTNSVVDHSGTSNAQTQLKEHHENILAKLKEIEHAEKAFKEDAVIRAFVEKVETGRRDVLTEYLTAAGTLTADVGSSVAACCMAVPKVADSGKSLLTAANLAKLPSAGLQSTISTASTAASTSDLVDETTAVANGGKAALAAGGAASKVAAASGVLGIAKGAVQLGLGINRLAKGSTTTADIAKVCEDAKAVAKSSQDLAIGCIACMKCAHKLDDTTVLNWMVSEHVGQVVSLE